MLGFGRHGSPESELLDLAQATAACSYIIKNAPFPSFRLSLWIDWIDVCLSHFYVTKEKIHSTVFIIQLIKNCRYVGRLIQHTDTPMRVCRQVIFTRAGIGGQKLAILLLIAITKLLFLIEPWCNSSIFLIPFDLHKDV